MPATDPKRYQTQCKDCKYPTYYKALEDPGYVPTRQLRGTARKKQINENRRRKKALKKKRQAKKMEKVRKRLEAAQRRKRWDDAEDAVPQKRAPAQRILETRLRSWDYLYEHGCCDCGERDPRVLTYDHLDPADKSMKVSDLISKGYGWESPRMVAEVAKCRVMCANCHMRHTVEQMEQYKHGELTRWLDERGFNGA